MSVTEKIAKCYICLEKVNSDKSIVVPITTGGHVYTHPECMERYMKSATTAAACGSCTGEKGCC